MHFFPHGKPFFLITAIYLYMFAYWYLWSFFLSKEKKNRAVVSMKEPM